MHTDHVNYYSMPELLRNIHYACMHVSHMPDMMSLGFAFDVNHVTMMSLGFASHSHHTCLMWHDVIGVHIV